MIASQPVNTTVNAGKGAKFRVIARGTAPAALPMEGKRIEHHWREQSRLHHPPATVGDNGSLFSVDVTNSISTVTNNDATLTLN
jgi:hypothetical protein